jgi:adenine-specific DNA-methyltransferase
MSELNFKGKEFVYNHHLSVPHRPLVPVADKSIGATRLDGNLIVQGDNLHALKSLLPMYANQVDCIFIDPPYNTGNEGWRYNDNVNSPMMQAWLQANPVGIEDGLRHDKWCAMMWPRLRLLHELLGEAGSIWITLDDNEIHRARGMLDSIFGEHNFVATCIWQKRTSPDARKNLGAAHDYVLVYAKNKPLLYLNKLPMSEMRVEDFTNTDKDPKGSWASVDLSAQEGHATKDQFYTIVAPNGKQHKPAEGRCWGLIESTYKSLFDEGRIWFGVDGNAKPRLKQYFEESGDSTVWTWWPNSEVSHTQEAKKEVLEIMGSEVFETPKPSKLLERIFSIATNKTSIVLDSFAGSGTTAHAVLDANKKDAGNRKFILVECEDYADTLTAERVRRVIKGYKFKGTQREELLRKSLNFTDLKRSDKLLDQIASIENLDAHRFDKIDKTVKNGELLVEGVKAIKEQKEGLGGSFTYCTLGDTIVIDRMLTGESLPSAEALGALLFHMATNEVKPVIKKAQSVGVASYLGESASFHVWLIYQPTLDFLTSREAALTLSLARALTAAKPAKAGANAKRHLVFAPAKFVSQKLLDEEKLPVEYAPLPWALYRVERS